MCVGDKMTEKYWLPTLLFKIDLNKVRELNVTSIRFKTRINDGAVTVI